MPNGAELEAIRVQTDRDGMQENGTGRKLTPQEIRESYPVVASRTGKVSCMPNMFWAMERELDARFLELMVCPKEIADTFEENDTRPGGTPKVHELWIDNPQYARLQGECHGISVVMSLMSSFTIEEITVSCMMRYAEWKGTQNG